jgi:hypothetical protein
MFDVVCMGILVADVIAKPIDKIPESGKLGLVSSIKLHNGGGAMSSSISLSKMGLKTAIIGKVGDDGFGQFLTGILSQNKVNTDGLVVDATVDTSSSVVLVESAGERTFLHCLGSNGAFSENDIDWNLVHLNSLKSFVKISCDLWNKGKTIYEISDILGHGDAAIRSYLKQGEKVKLCDYNADLNRLLSYEKFKFNNSESKSKPIICNETNMLFRNISLCEKLSKEMLGVKLDHRNINSVLSGKRKHTGHYTFLYISKEKFNITKQTSPELVFGDFFILPDKQQSA